jgi:5'(3')-deoxyribonucleotidase
MKLRIYIDLDGTICDLKGSVNKFRKENTNKIGEICYDYPWSLPGFFLSLEPMPLAIESVKNLAERFDVWFLSRPSFKNTGSYTEKAEWIKKYFGYDLQKKLILCGDKSLLKGKILVDDSDNASQDKFEGVWIRIGSDKYPDWTSVIERIEEISSLEINSL